MDQVEKIGFSHYRIHTSIEIDATPEQVWAVLVDTKAYENWAAFMVAVGGEIEDGNTITVDFQLNPAKPKRVTIDHRIEVTAGQEFFWAEKGPGGICDDHHFRVEATSDGRTRFVQSDEIKKGLTWLMGWKLSAIYRDGYQAFNQALKQEAERRAPAS
ncbi:SRPBCC domain-containing protein [Halocynthiibacter styelae]|uniref:SRPBCC domain-containing protein n=1 Tax=Halocynthiibacter styelae TaxID=2761955 RepID=A0A8J7LQ19_9RHOB|nr:SRPBCC domain-containing protein [Paenihalocynthiibacter styelae]MBI1493667.1 SRPBCC domain-containing protein [Paenihalocynthiibacter styelae]